MCNRIHDSFGTCKRIIAKSNLTISVVEPSLRSDDLKHKNSDLFSWNVLSCCNQKLMWCSFRNTSQGIMWRTVLLALNCRFLLFATKNSFFWTTLISDGWDLLFIGLQIFHLHTSFKSIMDETRCYMEFQQVAIYSHSIRRCTRNSCDVNFATHLRELFGVLNCWHLISVSFSSRKNIRSFGQHASSVQGVSSRR